MKVSYRTVRLLGYVALALAVLNFVAVGYKKISDLSYVYDPGVGLANEAMALLGVITIVISYSLKSLEEKVSQK